ncbi:MAG: glycosyltransferase family 4 protein [Desulfovibrio sp.]|nr:glycosyltransferase family 4 protein [Desulfovibrio sp.]
MSQTSSQHTKEPRLACVLLWSPLFTQPFIFREVEGLKAHVPLTVYTLYGKNLVHCSKAMRDAAPSVRTHGIKSLPSILLTLFREIATQPRRFFRLFRTSLCHKWPNLEVFGENLWAFCLGFLLAREFQTDGVTLIYAPWPRGTAQAAMIASSLTGIPFAITVRGDNLAPADPDLGLKMHNAALVRTNNYADQKRIEAFGAKEASGKTVLVYNSLTLDIPQTTVPAIASYHGERPLRLMALGRFDVTKGFDVLLKACALLRQKGLSFTLTLAGGGGIAMGLGKLEGELRSLTHTLGLDDCVSYPGLISHTELPRIMASHDIFLAPCVIDSSGRRDGIPNTVIEAMSMGLPVITTNIHALPEVIIDHETGLSVPPNDPASLCEAILTLANDPNLAVRLGNHAQEKAKKTFDPATNCKKVADLLKSMARS